MFIYTSVVEFLAKKYRHIGRHRARHSSRYGGVVTQLFDVVDLNVGVARLRLSWVLLMSCIDRQVVVNQNSGVKKPPAVSCIFSTGHVEVSWRSVLPTRQEEHYTRSP
jgi:hypothetical protein